MTSKAFFQSVARARETLRMLQEEKESYLDQATSLGGMGDTMIRSTEKRSRVESAAIRLAEITEKLNAQAQQYLDILEQARQIIGRLENIRHRQVLTYRYLCGYDWAEIQQKLGYQDPKSAYRVHGWALKEADQVLRDGDPCGMISKRE